MLKKIRVIIAVIFLIGITVLLTGTGSGVSILNPPGAATEKIAEAATGHNMQRPAQPKQKIAARARQGVGAQAAATQGVATQTVASGWNEWTGWMVRLQFLPACLALNVAVIAALTVLTLVAGRIYCSAICPLGIFQDSLLWLRRRLRPKKKQSFKKEHRILRYGVLAIFIACLIAGVQVIVALIDPYSIYGRMVGSIVKHQGWIVPTIAGITAGAVIILAWTGGRTWCNDICPVGTTLSFLSRFSIFRPVIDSGKCIHCGACERICRASCIDSKEGRIDASRCVDCFDCLESCKAGALSYRPAWGVKDNPKGPQTATKARAAKATAVPETSKAMAAEAVAAPGTRAAENQTAQKARAAENQTAQKARAAKATAAPEASKAMAAEAVAVTGTRAAENQTAQKARAAKATAAPQASKAMAAEAVAAPGTRAAENQTAQKARAAKATAAPEAPGTRAAEATAAPEAPKAMAAATGARAAENQTAQKARAAKAKAAPQTQHPAPGAARASGAASGTITQGHDPSRRAFLTAAAITAGTISLKAQKEKLDGGLAILEDKKKPLRKGRLVPFGAGSVKEFYSRCTACQLCVSACPEKVLKPSTDLQHLMQPEMSFEDGYCRPECTDCSQLCPSGAISPITPEEKSMLHIGTAVVDLSLCVVNRDGVSCGNCARHCPSSAIRMVPKEPGSSLRIPTVKEEACIGCGACEHLCPSRPYSAIHVDGISVHRNS